MPADPQESTSALGIVAENITKVLTLIGLIAAAVWGGLEWFRRYINSINPKTGLAADILAIRQSVERQNVVDDQRDAANERHQQQAEENNRILRTMQVNVAVLQERQTTVLSNQEDIQERMSKLEMAHEISQSETKSLRETWMPILRDDHRRLEQVAAKVGL